MEWLIVFIVNWVMLFLLIDWKAIKINVWAGFSATAMQMFVDTQFISHKLYIVHNPIINVMGSSFFFLAGPVFVVGILFAQYHPYKKWAIILHVALISLLYSLEEYFILLRGKLEYINWHSFDSIGINIGAISLLSWICIVILGKGRINEL